MPRVAFGGKWGHNNKIIRCIDRGTQSFPAAYHPGVNNSVNPVPLKHGVSSRENKNFFSSLPHV